MYYGPKLCPAGGNQGARSHTSAKLKKKPGKRNGHHQKPKDYEAAVITLTNIRMDNLENNTAKKSELSGDRWTDNTLDIGKLIELSTSMHKTIYQLKVWTIKWLIFYLVN